MSALQKGSKMDEVAVHSPGGGSSQLVEATKAQHKRWKDKNTRVVKEIAAFLGTKGNKD